MKNKKKKKKKKKKKTKKKRKKRKKRKRKKRRGETRERRKSRVSWVPSSGEEEIAQACEHRPTLTSASALALAQCQRTPSSLPPLLLSQRRET